MSTLLLAVKCYLHDDINLLNFPQHDSVLERRCGSPFTKETRTYGVNLYIRYLLRMSWMFENVYFPPPQP